LERGYNQAALLANGVSEALNCPARPDVLARPQATRSQTHLSRAERWQNVSGAFEARAALDGGTFLIVDDVLTTGSTAAAVAKTLKAAGAAEVWLATLAMART
jgi:predicted amidophosphoribosyltransferase